MFEVERERTCDVVKRAVGLTVAHQIDMRHTVGVLELAVACKAIEDEGKASITFNVTWTLEELVQDSANQVLRRRDKARHCDLVGEFAIYEPFIVCEVNIDLHV